MFIKEKQLKNILSIWRNFLKLILRNLIIKNESQERINNKKSIY